MSDHAIGNPGPDFSVSDHDRSADAISYISADLNRRLAIRARAFIGAGRGNPRRLKREDLARAGASGNLLERASALSHLGFELMNQKQYGEAERLFRRSQEIARQVEGPAGFWSLGASDDLGLLSQEQGREADAEAHFLEALHAAEKELGSEHHRVPSNFWGWRTFIISTGGGPTRLPQLNEFLRSTKSKRMIHKLRTSHSP